MKKKAVMQHKATPSPFNISATLISIFKTRLFIIASCALLLTGCQQFTDGTSPAAVTVQKSDLYHRNFVLIRYNDKIIHPKNMDPGIEFGERLHVSARMCNSFSGFGRLENGKLTVTELFHSDLKCLDPNLKGLDETVYQLFTQGAQIEFDKKAQRLILSDEDNTLIFRLADWVY